MRKWRDRVDFAFTGLTQRAVDALIELAGEIANTVPGGAQPLLPAQVIADPQPLLNLTDRCAELLRVRDRLRPRFRAHRRIGPVLLAAVVIYAAGWLPATLHYTGLVDAEWVGLCGLGIGGLGALVAVLAWVAYTYLEAELSRAEELSTTAL